MIGNEFRKGVSALNRVWRQRVNDDRAKLHRSLGHHGKAKRCKDCLKAEPPPRKG